MDEDLFHCECGSVEFIAVAEVPCRVPFEVQIRPADEALVVMGVSTSQDIESDDDPDPFEVDCYRCASCGKEYTAEEVFPEEDTEDE